MTATPEWEVRHQHSDGRVRLKAFSGPWTCRVLQWKHDKVEWVVSLNLPDLEQTFGTAGYVTTVDEAKAAVAAWLAQETP